MGTTFIEGELLQRSSSGILTPMRDGDIIQSSLLAMTTSSNPAGDAAVTTAIIDEFGGVIISLTGAGNAQTLENPTSSTAGKSFTVVSDDGNGAYLIEVNGITLSAGEAQRFIWDGSAWIAVTAVDADDIAFTPTGGIVATDVQAAIAEVDDEKMLRITSVDNEIARFNSTGGDVQGYTSNAPTISDSGATELKALLKLTGADADIFSLGDATHEGGDLKIYRDGSANLQLSLDADAASNTLALTVYGGVVAQNYLTVGQSALNTTHPLFVEGTSRFTDSAYFDGTVHVKPNYGVGSYDNNQSALPIDIAVIGTDSTNHAVKLRIDDNDIIVAQATGNGAGGIVGKRAIITGGQCSSKTDAGAADYNPSAITSDYIITVDTTAAARAVTISTEDRDSGSAASPRVFIIKDIAGNAGTNNITVSLETAGTIDGAATFVINGDYESMTLLIDGTNGFII